MKSDVEYRRVQLEPSILEKLVAEVKETVATGVEFSKAKKPAAFSAVNLWSIRKGRRTAASYRKAPAIINGFGF